MVTSNRGFEQWGEILHDEVMAAALLDRLLHRCHIAVLSLSRPARRARRKPPEHQKPSKVQTLRPASTTPTRDDHPWVTHHADPDTTIAGRARHRNGPSGKRNGKTPAPADLNSAASR